MIKQPKLVYPLLIFFILTPQIFTAKFVSDIISAVKNKPTLQSAIVISSAIVLFTISLASFIALIHMVRSEQEKITQKQFSEIQQLVTGEYEIKKLILSLDNTYELTEELLNLLKRSVNKNSPPNMQQLKQLCSDTCTSIDDFCQKIGIRRHEITAEDISKKNILESIAKLILKIMELEALINELIKETNINETAHLRLEDEPLRKPLRELGSNIGNLQKDNKMLFIFGRSIFNVRSRLSNLTQRVDEVEYRLNYDVNQRVTKTERKLNDIPKKPSNIQTSPSSSSSGTIIGSSKEVTQYSKEKEAPIKSKDEALEELSHKKRSCHVLKSEEGKVTIKRSASVKDTRAQVVEKSSFSREGNVSKSFASNFKSRKRQKNKSLNGSNNHAGKPNSKCNTKWQSITSIFSKERAC